jgi:hypothetical protein
VKTIRQKLQGYCKLTSQSYARILDILDSKQKTTYKKYIDERLPEEYEKCLVGLNAITK